MKRYKVNGVEEIEVKRFYLPLIITTKCPKCNHVEKYNFSEHYLSYPTINKPETISVQCKNCDDYYNINVTLKIAIEVDEVV